jgi:DNA-binding Lrp family transcriptional regulator
MHSVTLDDRDLAILRILQADARLTNAALAERVGLSPSTCLRRVRQIEESGIIDGYALLLHAAAAGFPGNAFIHVTLEQQGRTALDQFEAAIANVPEVLSCYLLAGSTDYLLHVVYQDSTDLERIHTNVLRRLPLVVRVQSTLSLRTVKRTTSLPV